MAEIVRTPCVLGGLSRLARRRIGVHHVLGALEACGGEGEVADQLEISTEAVQAAVTYAETHPMSWPRLNAGARSLSNAFANGPSTLTAPPLRNLFFS